MQNDLDTVKDKIHEANKQVGNTASILGIKDFSGVVLLISDQIENLIPQAISIRAQTALDLPAKHGRKYSNLHSAIIVGRTKGFSIAGRRSYTGVISVNDQRSLDFYDGFRAAMTEGGSDVLRQAGHGDAAENIPDTGPILIQAASASPQFRSDSAKKPNAFLRECGELHRVRLLEPTIHLTQTNVTIHMKCEVLEGPLRGQVVVRPHADIVYI